MKITPVAEMQQGIIISFYAIFFTFSARNPTLSNVFISLLTKCPKQRDPEHVKAWLIRVTVNKCNSLHRLAWRKRRESFAFYFSVKSLTL